MKITDISTLDHVEKTFVDYDLKRGSPVALAVIEDGILHVSNFSGKLTWGEFGSDEYEPLLSMDQGTTFIPVTFAVLIGIAKGEEVTYLILKGLEIVNAYLKPTWFATKEIDT